MAQVCCLQLYKKITQTSLYQYTQKLGIVYVYTNTRNKKKNFLGTEIYMKAKLETLEMEET